MYVYELKNIIHAHKQLKCAVLSLVERVRRAHEIDAAVGVRIIINFIYMILFNGSLTT